MLNRQMTGSNADYPLSRSLVLMASKAQQTEKVPAPHETA
jgi:hypothetical protein